MITYDKQAISVRGEALGEVWWQGRQWAVTAYGIECRDGTYLIDKQRLLEVSNGTHNWVAHVGVKNWVDVDDFATAYLVAIALHGFRLTEAMRAIVMKGYDRAIVSQEKDRLRCEMFPETGKLEALGIEELFRRNDAVDEEYHRRKVAEENGNG